MYYTIDMDLENANEIVDRKKTPPSVTDWIFAIAGGLTAIGALLQGIAALITALK
jgi:hypothetical protein